MVNFINAGGGDPLCTLHRAEGLYSWVTRKGYTIYMRDSSVWLTTSHYGFQAAAVDHWTEPLCGYAGWDGV